VFIILLVYLKVELTRKEKRKEINWTFSDSYRDTIVAFAFAWQYRENLWEIGENLYQGILETLQAIVVLLKYRLNPLKIAAWSPTVEAHSFQRIAAIKPHSQEHKW
jgi:hypothetical protein